MRCLTFSQPKQAEPAFSKTACSSAAAELHPQLLATLQQHLLPTCATFEMLIRAAAADRSTSPGSSAAKGQSEQLSLQVCATMRHLTAALRGASMSNLAPWFLVHPTDETSCETAPGGGAAAASGGTVCLPQQLVSLLCTALKCGSLSADMGDYASGFAVTCEVAGALHQLLLTTEDVQSFSEETASTPGPGAAGSISSTAVAGCELCNSGSDSNGLLAFVPLFGRVWKLLGALCAMGLQLKDSVTQLDEATTGNSAPTPTSHSSTSNSSRIELRAVKSIFEEQVQALEWIARQLKQSRCMVKPAAWSALSKTGPATESNHGMVAASAPAKAASTVGGVSALCNPMGADIEQLLEQCLKLQTGLERALASSSRLTCTISSADCSTNPNIRLLQSLSLCVGSEVSDQLQALGDALNDQVVLHVACNNFPHCRSFSKSSEQARVGAKTCSSCGVAAYCSRECQVSRN